MQEATEDVLVRVPPLKHTDRLLIIRADHGGYIVEVETQHPGSLGDPKSTVLVSHTVRTTVALSTYVDLQDWLHQVFIRWLPVVEWIAPAPRKKNEVSQPIPRED